MNTSLKFLISNYLLNIKKWSFKSNNNKLYLTIKEIIKHNK